MIDGTGSWTIKYERGVGREGGRENALWTHDSTLPTISLSAVVQVVFESKFGPLNSF